LNFALTKHLTKKWRKSRLEYSSDYFQAVRFWFQNFEHKKTVFQKKEKLLECLPKKFNLIIQHEKQRSSF